MPRGQKPDYDVFVSQSNNEKNYYTRVGAAWKVSKGGISIALQVLPLDGKLVLFPPKADES